MTDLFEKLKDVFKPLSADEIKKRMPVYLVKIDEVDPYHVDKVIRHVKRMKVRARRGDDIRIDTDIVKVVKRLGYSDDEIEKFIRLHWLWAGPRGGEELPYDVYFLRPNGQKGKLFLIRFYDEDLGIPEARDFKNVFKPLSDKEMVKRREEVEKEISSMSKDDMENEVMDYLIGLTPNELFRVYDEFLLGQREVPLEYHIAHEIVDKITRAEMRELYYRATGAL